MKKMKALLLSLCALFLISCVTVPASRTLPDPKGKIYTTYLINESPHFAEYIIENVDAGVYMYSGVIPPKWAVKNEMDSWEKWNKAPGKLPWVLKVEIHEDLLGTYKIHLRFLYSREGAATDGRWRFILTSLTKKDFDRDDNLIPYWEINDDPVKKSNFLESSLFQNISAEAAHECEGDHEPGHKCENEGTDQCKKGFEVPMEKAERFMYFMSLKNIKIMSDEYSEYMELVYYLLHGGYEKAGNVLRDHIGDMELL